MTLRDDLVLKFGSDRVLAHQSLFAHRHPDLTPPFHDELIGLWHSPTPRVLTLAFRSGGKSTLAEEALVLIAAQGLVRNILIIGSNSDRANDRLRAIKYEFETNEDLIDLYGNLHGSVWNEGRIVLANGVCIQAFGRGQALMVSSISICGRTSAFAMTLKRKNTFAPRKRGRRHSAGSCEN